MKTLIGNGPFGRGLSKTELFGINWFVGGWLPIIFGLIALFWPNQTVQGFVSLIAVFLIYEGVSRLFSSYRTSVKRRLPASRLESVPESLLCAALGLTGLLWPNTSALAFFYLIAVCAIGVGLIALIGSVTLRLFIPGGSRMGFPGALPITFGLLLLIFPGFTTVALVRFIGVYAVGSGVLRLIQPQATQRLEQDSAQMFGEISRAL
jgi:uncharacterized membrane protein HdeD (DUF308 family)